MRTERTHAHLTDSAVDFRKVCSHYEDSVTFTIGWSDCWRKCGDCGIGGGTVRGEMLIFFCVIASFFLCNVNIVIVGFVEFYEYICHGGVCHCDEVESNFDERVFVL